MSNDLKADAGNVLAGKEERLADRAPGTRVHRAKIRTKPGAVQETVALEKSGTVAENQIEDDVYMDVLMKFGIQI